MTGEGGYFKIARGWMDHPELTSVGAFSKREAWLWLIEEAAFAEHRKRVGSAIIDLRRGQLSASTRFMGKAWGWEETKVRRFLTRLKTASMITADTAAGQLIITICNYCIYQGSGQTTAAPSAADNTAGPPQQRRKLERKEEGNQGKKDSPSLRADLTLFSEQPNGEAPDDFEIWWQFTPKKVGKGQAQRAFATALKRAGALQVLSEGIVRYAASVAGTDPKFIAHPATWLNGDRWLDGIDVSPFPQRSIDDEWEAAKAAGSDAMDAFIAKQRGKS